MLRERPVVDDCFLSCQGCLKIGWGVREADRFVAPEHVRPVLFGPFQGQNDPACWEQTGSRDSLKGGHKNRFVLVFLPFALPKVGLVW